MHSTISKHRNDNDLPAELGVPAQRHCDRQLTLAQGVDERTAPVPSRIPHRALHDTAPSPWAGLDLFGARADQPEHQALLAVKVLAYPDERAKQRLGLQLSVNYSGYGPRSAQGGLPGQPAREWVRPRASASATDAPGRRSAPLPAQR